MPPENVRIALENEVKAPFQLDHHEYRPRIHTPHLYPDGTRIDLFYETAAGNTIITDLADTAGWIRLHTAGPTRSPELDRRISSICAARGVTFQHDRIQARWRPGEDLNALLERLAQATRSAAALVYPGTTR